MAATLVSLAEAKAHLNITSGAEDAEIMRVIEAVTVPIERVAGSVAPTAHTEIHPGSRPVIVLSHQPVLSVTSVTGPGGVVDAEGYALDGQAGVLARMSGVAGGVWEAGQITVTYTAGLASVPPHVRLAALIVVQHLWETQRGGRDQRFTGAGEEGWNPGLGFALPRRALELLGDPMPGIA